MTTIPSKQERGTGFSQMSHYMADHEREQRRRSNGEFGEKANSAPEVGLEALASPAVNADTFLSSTLAGASRVEVRQPVGVTATRAALRNSRGEADGALRLVELSWASVPAASGAGDFAVVGPKDGRPLVVYVDSGFPQLFIESGNVVVVAESGAGHSIKVGGTAHATILCGEGRKVSSRTSGSGVTDVYLDEKGWGSHRTEDRGTVTLHGTDRHGRDVDEVRTDTRTHEQLEAWMAAR